MDKQIAEYISKLQKLLRGNMTNENAVNICKEIESHLSERAADLESTGMSLDAAVAMAIEEFGSRDRVASTFIGAGLGLRLFGWAERVAVFSFALLAALVVFAFSSERAGQSDAWLQESAIALFTSFVIGALLSKRVLIEPIAAVTAIAAIAFTLTLSFFSYGPQRDGDDYWRGSQLRENMQHYPRTQDSLTRQRAILISGLNAITEADAERTGLKSRREWRIPVNNKPSFKYIHPTAYLGTAKTWTEARSIWQTRGKQTLASLDSHLEGLKREWARTAALLAQPRFSDVVHFAKVVLPLAMLWLAFALGINAICFAIGSVVGGRGRQKTVSS